MQVLAAVLKPDGLLSTRRQVWVAVSASLAVVGAWLLVPDPMVPIAFAAALWAALAVLFRPFLTCLVFVAFSYFRLHEAFPLLYPLHIPELAGLGAMTATVLHVSVMRSAPPNWPRELKLFLAFFGLVSVGTLVAVVPEVAMAYWSDIFVKIAIMTFAIAWLARTADDFAAVNRLFIVCGLLVASAAIYNYVNGIDLVGTGRVTIGRELKSALGDPNDLAFILLLPLSFAAAQLVHRSDAKNTLWAALIAPVIVVAIVATQSRGGLIGAMVVIMVIGHRVLRNKWLLWSGCGALVLVLYIAMGIGQRHDMGGMRGGVDESSYGRLYGWSVATEMALKRPLTGVGLDNFVAAYDDYRKGFDNADHTIHSTWFAVLAEVGFPGLFIFIALVATCFKRVWMCTARLAAGPGNLILRASALSLTAGLAGVCAGGTFLNQAFTWPLYIIVALIAALANLIAKDTSSAEIAS